jgi:hypothetical protein
MAKTSFQYRLWDLMLVVASAALVLGAARGEMARQVLIVASLATVLVVGAGLMWLAFVLVFEGAAAARQWAWTLARLPFRLRQLLFERRLARLRPGHPAQRVRRLLGSPRKVEGFGDRLYWSYRIAGRRYTVSFDPRKLVATYSGGLARDLPRRRRRVPSLEMT